MNSRVEKAKEWINEISSQNSQDLDRILFFMNLMLTKRDLYYENVKLKREKERLNNKLEFKETNIKGLENNIEVLEEVIKKYENIIKEAREYIQDRYDGEVLTHTFDKDNVKELLEILDKVEENK